MKDLREPWLACCCKLEALVEQCGADWRMRLQAGDASQDEEARRLNGYEADAFERTERMILAYCSGKPIRLEDPRDRLFVARRASWCLRLGILLGEIPTSLPPEKLVEELVRLYPLALTARLAERWIETAPRP
jgi:hypothetical protein